MKTDVLSDYLAWHPEATNYPHHGGPDCRFGPTEYDGAAVCLTHGYIVEAYGRCPGASSDASSHGWALCIDHDGTPDPRYPEDPPPRPFQAVPMTRNRIYTDPDLLDLRRDIRLLFALVAILAAAVIALAAAVVL